MEQKYPDHFSKLQNNVIPSFTTKKVILKKSEGNSEFNFELFPIDHHVVFFCELRPAELGSIRANRLF